VSKKLIGFLAASALLGTTAYGVSLAYAEEGSGSYPPIIQKLVERFDLDSEEVVEVFSEARQERQAEKEERFAGRLEEAVSQGELTEEQKEALLAKHEELQQEREANREEFRSLSWEERRELRQSRREELEAWAQANGIDVSYLFGGLLGCGRRGGFMGGGGKGL
jgi:hypothetical protein